MEDNYLEHLKILLGHLRKERRNLAKTMAAALPPGSFNKLVDLQRDFDAVERAIKDEENEAKKPQAGGQA